jgi:hypothetical protein
MTTISLTGNIQSSTELASSVMLGRQGPPGSFATFYHNGMAGKAFWSGAVFDDNPVVVIPVGPEDVTHYIRLAYTLMTSNSNFQSEAYALRTNESDALYWNMAERLNIIVDAEGGVSLQRVPGGTFFYIVALDLMWI